MSRLLDTPVELVWEVWTKPEHLSQWWGPNGFTNRISKMDVRSGGEWDLVMHGPDGRHMLFRSAEEFIHTVKTFSADEGLKQNVEKLSRYLSVHQQKD